MCVRYQWNIYLYIYMYVYCKHPMQWGHKWLLYVTPIISANISINHELPVYQLVILSTLAGWVRAISYLYYHNTTELPSQGLHVHIWTPVTSNSSTLIKNITCKIVNHSFICRFVEARSWPLIPQACIAVQPAGFILNVGIHTVPN